MGFIDRARTGIANFIRPKAVKKEWDGSGTGYYQTSVAHKIQELIEGSLKYDSADPRDHMRIATLLIENVPPLKRAVQLQADFIGRIKIESEDKTLKDSLQKWADKVPIRNVLNPDYAFFKSLTEYCRQLTRVALTKGMAFSEEYYTEGGFDGLVVYDSEKFNFQSLGNKSILTYTSASKIDFDVQLSDHFHAFGITFMPGSLWGQSMVSGSEFFSEILIQMMVSLKNNYIRYGSPLGINMLSLKPNEQLGEDDYKKFQEKATAFQNAIMGSLREMERGARSEIFSFMPSEVSYDHKTYGDGLQPMAGMREDIAAIMRQVAGLTGIPIELLSFDTSGDGFSGEKWRVLYSILNVKLESIRMLLEPHLMKIIRNYLISVNAPTRALDSFWIEFESLDFSNDKTQAETEEIRSRAIAQNLQNALTIFNDIASGDTEAMREFLERVHIDVPVGNPTEFEPKPPANV